MINNSDEIAQPTEADHTADELLAHQLKAIAWPVRICILRILLTHARGTLTVEDLRSKLYQQGYDLAQPMISYHLGVLWRARIIECERFTPPCSYYVVRHEVLFAASELFGGLVEHAKQQIETRKEQ